MEKYLMALRSTWVLPIYLLAYAGAFYWSIRSHWGGFTMMALLDFLGIFVTWFVCYRLANVHKWKTWKELGYLPLVITLVLIAYVVLHLVAAFIPFRELRFMLGYFITALPLVILSLRWLIKNKPRPSQEQ